MGEEGETVEQRRSSLAAPLVFLIVLVFHFLSRWLEQLKKRGSKNETEIQLRAEIKQLLIEASSLSQPSTFAQAAKLRRIAAAKEKELANCQQVHTQVIKGSYDLSLKILFISKVVTYIVLVYWFWRAPVAAISRQLVQPFGHVLSWGAGGSLNDYVMVGIIPWLILSTRVSKFLSQLCK
ncbi:uncharacterized protein LOC110825731 [Carica papaya]|uniref:uncharacterized protein LOC110825731 n=1 Tax=Carica papaya TaxID=3649 RepID=UPI000B8C995E|nr:uncharacterized protein LOC110825731 [Carica papaya]